MGVFFDHTGGHLGGFCPQALQSRVTTTKCQDRERLRRTQCEVSPHAPISLTPAPFRKIRPVGKLSLQDGDQVVVFDLPRQSELLGALTEPQ